MKKINLLETTLRDGSYVINFSFTAADTEILCRELEEAGFTYIEVGHGVGLNASNAGYGRAAEMDEDYMIAAEGALTKKARYGMFCIPGIARLEDLDLAGRHGMNFVRIGTNITQVRESEPFIKKAKELGMFVTANYMKSYVLPPEKFAENVLLSEKYGVDMVYLVDSAGGMFPEDVKKYYDAIRKVSNVPLGFHGHNNLGMAVANSLYAADIGFDFIDCSLQGIGRSSGNAPTELLIAALMKKGFELPIDFRMVLELGDSYVQPLLKAAGHLPLDVVAGFADFHSSYMHHIMKYSSKYKVDPILLILEITKVDKVNVNENVLDRIAQNIKREEKIYSSKYGFSHYVGGEQDEPRKRLPRHGN